MKKWFQQDNPFIRFLTRVCDLMILNVLLVLLCMTIVCSGAAIAALYSVTLKMWRGEDEFIVKDFFRAFRDGFVAATPATILMFVDILLMAILRYALYAETLIFSPYVFVILAIVSVFLTALLSYVFPLLARYENRFTRHIGNALRLAVVHLPVTFFVTCINLLPMLAGIFLPSLWGYVVGVWLLVGAAASAYANSFYLNRILEG